MKISVKIFITLITFLIGCDIFSTRAPEDPSEIRSSYPRPTTPDLVITNFKNSIEEFNIDEYIKCFVDTTFSDKHFEFIPSLETGIDRSLFLNWDIESERQYLINLGKPPFGKAILNLSNKKLINITSDSVIYYFDYSLDYPHNHSNMPTNFSGNLQFYIAVDINSAWSIYRWFDFNTTSSYSWSYLKAIFSSGLR